MLFSPIHLRLRIVDVGLKNMCSCDSFVPLTIISLFLKGTDLLNERRAYVIRCDDLNDPSVCHPLEISSC